MIPRLRGVEPSPGVAGVRPYSVPKHGAPIDLQLDKNEGEAPPAELLERMLQAGPDLMRRYPDQSRLQHLLAGRFGVESANLIVTAGADDALDRLCRAVLKPGEELVTTNPSFEMLPRYARVMGANVVECDWHGGQFPTEQIIAAITPRTKIVAIVSPNNPTGLAVTREDIQRVAEAIGDNTVLLCDFAYIEFADEDLTDFALQQLNTAVVRTMSKAWGCAGLRVGYAIGPEELIQWMRAAGGPYAVSRPSIALACARLEADRGEMERFVQQVREDRRLVGETLREYGADVPGSQANFVYTQTPKAAWITDALAGQGIAIRGYSGHPRLSNALRITCPGNAEDAARLAKAIRRALDPEFLVLTQDALRGEDGSLRYPRAQLEAVASRYPLVLTSARARGDVEHFLQEHAIGPLFRMVFCTEDGEYLPPPLSRGQVHATLGVTRGWFVGNNLPEIRAARAEALVPLAVLSREERSSEAARELQRAGAARVLEHITGLEDLLP